MTKQANKKANKTPMKRSAVDTASEAGKMADRGSGSGRGQSEGNVRGRAKINAIELLKSDHQTVKDLFGKYEIAGSAKQKSSIAEQIFMELDIHSQLEEEIFYPAMESTDQQGKDMVEKSLEEHREVKKLIEELRASDIASEYYDEKIQLLLDNVEHHVEEEEGEMFPEAEVKLGDALDRLGEEMEQRKDQLIAVR